MRYRLVAASLAIALCGVAVTARAADPGDTRLSGRMYFDFTHIDQKNSDTGKTDASGMGLDVKRFYFQVDHQFDDVWSATLITDFSYVSNDGSTNLFVKKAYVQGTFGQEAVLRVGSADTPWVPLVEKFYGLRYIEKAMVDRLSYGTSADWGVHLGGDIGQGKAFNYAVAVLNGAGYRNPSRSKSVDFEARVGFVPVDGMIIALGGYSGKRGQETENADAFNTASRADAMIAWDKDDVRVGGEYFQARNWGTVLLPVTDRADGWSVWGSIGVGEGVTVFARYDKANLSKDIDPDAKDTYYNAGVEFQVTQGFKLAAVYKHQKGEKTAGTPLPIHVADVTTNEIGVWGEVRF